MRHAPRKLIHALAAALACAACATPAHAQPRDKTAAQAGQEARPARESKAPDAKAPGGKSRDAKARDERARAQKLRRKAVALLLEVEGGAKEIEDTYRRASVLAACADALWEADEPAARPAFARAWEAAVESDDAELKDEQENGRYGDSPERFTRARDLVLAAAARRDTRMTEAWLGALAEWLSGHESRARDESAPGREAGRDAGGPDEFTRDGQRLALASSLADEEDYEAAARVAAPAVKGGASGPLVEFLLGLRAGAPDEADRLYLQLLAAVRADPNADANDVLLLSSYALTPRLLAVVNKDGSIQFRPLGGAPVAAEPTNTTEPSARAREAFFDAAAAVLLRPARPGAASAGDAAAAYFAAGRLLRDFEAEAPRHAPALRARLAELAGAVDVARRAALDSQMTTRSLSPSNPSDPLAGLIDTARKAGDPSLRDDARLQAVREAARRRLWERARGQAEEIEDQEKRREARAVIDAFQVASAADAFGDKEDGFERLAALARAADVTPALRSYGLARAAELAAGRGKRERSEALLSEALALASEAAADASARESAGSVAAATIAARIGSPRAWEALSAAVVALNEDAVADGDEVRFRPEARPDYSPGEADTLNELTGRFGVSGMFGAAARGGFDRAVAEARNLRRAPARALALVAAARAALEGGGPAAGASARRAR
jgi:hypothetical protein